ncbi:MAG: CoA transferase [Burkholderiales bacterium]|nr:CoA transferase [Burkholderiales bacterium]
MSGPLHNVRVIDLTTIGMGPYATQTLGNLGADVIKVEAPPAGDLIRGQAPGRHPDMSPLYLNLNRNKRSIVLDLKIPQARDVLTKLIDGADVFVSNVRMKSMERLGLGYGKLAARNPRLIYCSLVGASQRGPYAARAAFDDLIQGASGLAYLEGRMAGEPHYTPAWIADQTVGLVAVYAITAALYQRERTGKGECIEVPMLESMVEFVMTPHLAAHTFQPPQAAAGYTRLFHRKPYKTLDGYLCGGPYSVEQWKRFFDIAGLAHLKGSTKYATREAVAAHVAELYALFADVLRSRTTAEWVGVLEQADIPVMPMHTLESVQDDPHLKAVGFFRDVDHPSEGRIRTMANPTRWASVEEHPARPAPRLGEHGHEILRELAYSEAEIDALVACRATAPA